MTAIQIKTSLHNLIDGIKDKQVLSVVYSFLAKLSNGSVSADDFNALPAEAKKGIEEGLAQLKKGQKISYEEFQKRIRKKYNL